MLYCVVVDNEYYHLHLYISSKTGDIKWIQDELKRIKSTETFLPPDMIPEHKKMLQDPDVKQVILEALALGKTAKLCNIPRSIFNKYILHKLNQNQLQAQALLESFQTEMEPQLHEMEIVPDSQNLFEFMYNEANDPTINNPPN